MKKVLMIALTVLISAAFVTTVFAQVPKTEIDKAKAAGTDKAKAEADKATTAATDKAKAAADKPVKADKPAKVKTMKASGEVLKISEEEGIIVVKGKKGDETYDIKDVKWKVYKDAKEVKTGEIVVISYIDKDGKKVAKIVGKAAKKAAKKEAPKADKTEAPAPAPEKK